MMIPLEELEQFGEFLKKVTKRPGIYVYFGTIWNVGLFLEGYTFGLENSGRINPLAGWMYWVGLQFSIFHPAWHWTRILLHHYGSDQAALDVVPDLYREYCVMLREIGADGIEQQTMKTIRTKYGKDTYEPESTTTSLINP